MKVKWHSSSDSIVYSLLVNSTNCDITFLFNFWEQGVKVLGIVIVKQTWVSIMLCSNMEYCSYFFRIHSSFSVFSAHRCLKSWSVRKLLFWCLLFIFTFLDWEIVLWFKPRFVSPIGSVGFCVFLLSLFAPSCQPVFPCYSST